MGCCKVLKIIFLLALEIADLVLDWDFYYEVSKTEDVNEGLKHSILFFAIFGTILFLCILFNKIVIYRSNDDEEDNARALGLSFVSTMFEDLPQIVLAILVALTTKELISSIQIAKAAYAIAEPLIQIGFTSYQIHKLRKDIYDDNSCKQCCKVMEIIISVFLAIFSFLLLIHLLHPFIEKVTL